MANVTLGCHEDVPQAADGVSIASLSRPGSGSGSALVPGQERHPHREHHHPKQVGRTAELGPLAD
jgi:hypothetical protein